IQPLTESQIDDYLLRAGEQMAGVRTMLEENPTLRELARLPLMLNVIVLAYHDKLRDLPVTGTRQEQQKHIFSYYIERMLEERRGSPGAVSYTPGQTIRWLSVLARQMQRRSQSIFYLEHIQADWLRTAQKEIYQGVAVRMMGMLIGV